MCSVQGTFAVEKNLILIVYYNKCYAEGLSNTSIALRYIHCISGVLFKTLNFYGMEGD